MNFVKILLFLGLATLMVGCNTESSSDNTEKDDDSDNAVSELSLAKAFVQDFAGLQNSLAALEVPATEFAGQIENDLSTADEADAEAFALVFEAVMSQLVSELEAMVTDDETGFQIDFDDVPDTDFVEDPDLGVTFSDSSIYSLTNTGLISAAGEATVEVGGTNESVIFNLDFSLPEIDDQDTGSVAYELNTTINFTADTLILSANNASGILKLELGDKTVAEFSENGLQGSELALIEMGIEELSLDVGSLRFDGAGTLAINEFTQSDIYDEDFIPVFSIESQGKLTTSDDSYLDASMSLSGTFEYASDGSSSSSSDIENPEVSYSESEFSKANLSYSFTTTFKTDEHDFNVSAEGSLSGESESMESWSEDSYSYTSQSSAYTEGGVTINHNGAEFIIDFEFDFNEKNSQDSFDEQIDLLIQDATVTSHTVIIVLGDFDNVDTDAFEFGQVRVNGTRYGTLLNDDNATKAEFTDGSLVVVFDGF